jgi:hypothetical protein
VAGRGIRVANPNDVAANNPTGETNTICSHRMLGSSRFHRAMADTMASVEFNFAALIFFLWFLPFLVSLLGRDRRWKGLALALCLATMLSSSSDLLTTLCWLGAWMGAVLAILARLNLIKEQRSCDLDW